jgi:uncharacterized repeat protein (TIGR02543 family)
MRKNVFIELAVLLSLTILIVACSLDDIDELKKQAEEQRSGQTVTVAFNANEGTPAPGQQTVGKNGKVAEPQSMSQTGYTFEGWYREEDFTSRWNFTSDTVSGNVTLYAKWNPVSYTVSYDKNAAGADGTTADSTHTYDETKALTVNGYSLSGYTFVGWNAESDGSGASYTDGQNVTNLAATPEAVVPLYAKWTNNPYTVTYDADGGSQAPFSPINVEYGAVIDQPDAMTKTGYTFGGWYTDTAKTVPAVFPITVSGNVSLYAKWNANTYTVTYNKNNDNAGGDMFDSSHVYDVPKALNGNNYLRLGFTFAGWAKTERGAAEFEDKQSVVNLSAEDNAAVTLYARWGGHAYYIAYDKNSDEAAEIMTPSTFTSGVEQVLKGNTFTRRGYTFAGWAMTRGGVVDFTDRQPVDLAVSAGETVTLYAKWTANTLDIGYANGGGSGSGPASPTSAVYGGINVIMLANTYTRTGYTFAGWAVSGEGCIPGTHGAGVSVAVTALSTAINTGNANITLTATETVYTTA